jgi:hypothetical protein
MASSQASAVVKMLTPPTLKRNSWCVCHAAGWSIAKQAAEVDDLKQQADIANERAAQASGAQQLRQVRLQHY